MDVDKFKEVVEKVLSKWELWSTSGLFICGKSQCTAKEMLYCEYRRHTQSVLLSDTRVSLNLEDNILYLVSIYLLPSDRGKGYGNQLYELVVEIGREINADCVVQTASGWTPSGETRRNYLLRRGWKDRPGGEMEVYYRLRCAR